MREVSARTVRRLAVALLVVLSLIAFPAGTGPIARSTAALAQSPHGPAASSADAKKKQKPCKKGFHRVNGKCKKVKKAKPTPKPKPTPQPTPTLPSLPAGTYQNPLNYAAPGIGNGVGQVCPDPSIIYAQTDKNWYVYCTTDYLNDKDISSHIIPILQSPDLVHWTYKGPVFETLPTWVKSGAGLWAPDIHFFNGHYVLYYTASDTNAGGSAIGVATAPSPTGPWTDSGGPVVEPHAPPCCPGDKMWTFDPFEVEDNGQRYIFYGSYYGGIQARKLSADGLHSDPATQKQIIIDNKYEGTFLVHHGDYWYFFGSTSNCCNGPLTGYSVFSGRSKDILGPYVDRSGHSLLDSQTGASTVISMNGNRWVGTGHNAVFTDFAGQDWFLYHAIDRNDPYTGGAIGAQNNTNKRELLMDPLDWVDGWPTVRGGNWASDSPMPAPAAQPGEPNRYTAQTRAADQPGTLIPNLSDDFNGSTLSSQWTWVRQPDPSTYGVQNGEFRFDTQGADLYVNTNNASVLTEPTPAGSYMVEVKVRTDVPVQGGDYNYRQGGFVIYKDDDNFIKLVQFANFDTRQTEFAKELSPVPANYPRYGNSTVGPPGVTTWLRIVKTTSGSEELYRSYTSADGQTWEPGGVWTHQLGSAAKIGLISMGGAGSHSYFDYVHVYQQP